MPTELRPAEPSTFGDRLASAFATYGQLCVGIDPHPYLLEEWGLPDSAEGLREFGLRVVEATAGRAGVVKPQVAFFERHGSAGYAALESVIAAARQAGLLLIADVKRGDIGSTVEAYAQAWLTPNSPLEADAITVSAFQGVGSLAAPIALAQQNGKGLFVLAATSNPGSLSIQTAKVVAGARSGSTVAAGIVSEVVELNRLAGSSIAPGGIAPVGVVLGATVDFASYRIPLAEIAGPPATPVLAPGFGHQGTPVSELSSRYREAAPYAIVTAGRSLLAAGPAGIAEAITRQTSELAACRG